jgi:hypothetical protein
MVYLILNEKADQVFICSNTVHINQKPTVEAPEYFMDGYLDEEDDLQLIRKQYWEILRISLYES